VLKLETEMLVAVLGYGTR